MSYVQPLLFIATVIAAIVTIICLTSDPPLRPLRSLREAILRAFAPSRATQKLQVDLSWATTDELLDELTNRSRAAVIVVSTLAQPDSIRARYGGRGDTDNGARTCELLGLIDFARTNLREMTKKGGKQ